MPFENLYAPEFSAAVAADANAVILDVRTSGEVAEGIIPGAIHIDIYQADFITHLLELDPAKNYYVYCRSGGRSSQACMMLESSGFTGRLVNLAGGITNYDGTLGKLEG
ncbi:MAG: rhodanese-like domain-containing protein [Bacteroidia bacterium]|jgi:rhodanese-related sulfurtransferase